VKIKIIGMYMFLQILLSPVGPVSSNHENNKQAGHHSSHNHHIIFVNKISLKPQKHYICHTVPVNISNNYAKYQESIRDSKCHEILVLQQSDELMCLKEHTHFGADSSMQCSAKP
jgi:hypothetical protein